MQLFKNNCKTIFTEIKARANITHNPELSGLFLKGGLEKCCYMCLFQRKRQIKQCIEK